GLRASREPGRSAVRDQERQDRARGPPQRRRTDAHPPVIEGVSPDPFFTVGHSTRSVAEIVALLDTAEVQLVVDVRTVPRSQRNPQFNRETLPGTLAAARIGYEHLPALGGLRGRTSGVPADVNAFWTNQSFHNYADYAMGEAWRAGSARL